MQQVLFAIVAAACCLPTILGQSKPEKISCYAAETSSAGSRSLSKKLWDGCEISLGPAKNREGGGDDCTAAIYNGAGRVVFRTTGCNVIFDEKNTGQDFDGDGKPEVVFMTDTGGGITAAGPTT